MANLVQVAEELEYVPKEQLIQMSQSPDSRYPQYLVLSEIQRRTQMEKMYNAQEASMNQPQMTVADEVVSNYAQPQGLAGMSANGSANTDAFSPEVAMPAPSSPMQMMAQGGRVGYQNLGYTGLRQARGLDYGNIDPTMIDPRWSGYYDLYGQSGPLRRKSLLESLGIDASEMSEDEIQQALLFAAQPRDKEGTIIRYPEAANIAQTAQFDENYFSAEEIEKRAEMKTEREQNWLAGEDRRNAERNERINTGNVLFADLFEQTPSGSGRLLGLEESGLGEENYNKLIEQYNARENDSASRAMNESMNATQDDSLVSKFFPYGLSGAGSEFNPYTPYPQGSSENIPTQDEINAAVDSAESDIYDWISKRYTDPDGTIDWTQGLSDATWAVPGYGALKGLGWAATKYGPKLWKNRNLLWQRRNPNLKVTKSGKRDRRFKDNPEFIFDKRKGWLYGGGAFGLGQWFQGDKEFQEAQEKGKNGENGGNDFVNTQKELMDYLNTLDQGDLYGSEGTTKKGLAGAGGDDRWLDIAQLGGIVMSARNMSELGAGITALAGNIKDRRAKDRLETIQGDYYESMTEKYRADVKMMPVEQLDSLLTQYQKYAEMLEDGSIDVSEEERASFDMQYRELLKEAAERQGFDFKTQSEMDAEAMAGMVSITG
jgi:hypothetical protein